MKVASIVGVFCLFTSVLGNGEFSILHSPNGVNFRGDEQLNTSELPKIISTAMGHTTPSGDSWNGLTVLNPFNYPEVAVAVVVEGVQSLQLSEPRYPLEITSNLDQVKDDFTSILGQVVFDENDLYSGETQKILALQKLNKKDVAVLQFLKDIDVLMDLKHKVLAKSVFKTVWIRLNGLDDIISVYGQDSEQALEAVTILKSALGELQDALENTYGDRFILTAITNERIRIREKRSTTSNAKANSELYWKLNLSKRYGSDYSSIFNILLWTSVFLIAALISTAVFICTLDPGRDSIIYRMTTQRIKKEN
ncbi:renin receptor-like [Daphnia pulicaria]|uniref:renin receptor-like n=1 Tax=Daphnia pulicaria TaxID=35523 RepID=UPI001EEBC113|nr:renin receptor-like [Daphnia pulicaria]